MFNRLRDAQRDYISKGGNFVAFEFWSGRWFANMGGIFDEEELQKLANLLKTPTSKRLTNKLKVQKDMFDDK